MAGYTLSALEADVRNYTEVSSTVLTGAILGRFIENAEYRIFYDVPIDAYRYVKEGQFAADDNTLNMPGSGSYGLTGTMFVRGIEVFDSTANTEGKGTWLIKKDQTYLSEYTDRLTGPEGNLTASAQALQLFLNRVWVPQCVRLITNTGIAVGVCFTATTSVLVLEYPTLPKHFFHKNFKNLIITVYR